MRNVLVLLFIWALLQSCRRDNINDLPARDNKKVTELMFDAFNRHDWDSMAHFYTDTSLFLDPGFGQTYIKQDRSQIVAKYSTLGNLLPDIHNEIKEISAYRDKVTIEFTSSGTIDSSHWERPVCTILTIKDGKIVRDATYYDK